MCKIVISLCENCPSFYSFAWFIINTVTGTTAINNTVNAYRDKNTVGTPVIMTVTAPDGGVRKFGLWSFDAQVQSTAGNSYTFSTATPFANDVIAMELVVADGTFQKLLPENGSSSDILIPTADVMFEKNRTTFRLTSTGWQFGATTQSYWYGHVTTSDYEYFDYDGFSTTFTAPKDGNLTVSTFWPVLGANGTGASSYTAAAVSTPLSHEIRVYNADGTYETKYTVVYAADGADTSRKCLFNTITSKTLGTNATFDDKGTADIADDTVTFDIKKGQIVRVLLTTKTANYLNSVGVTFANLPFPTFTYNQTTADAMGSTIVATPVVGDATLTADNVLALIYNAAGELVQTAKGNDVTIENGKVSVTVTDSNAAYAKLFFFESLENVRPIASDIVVRK